MLLLGILTIQAACSNTSGTGADSIGELITLSSQANNQHDLEAEERYLRMALTKDGSDREKAEVRRSLARTMWKFHRDFAQADALLEEAVRIPADQTKAWVERALMLTSRGDYGKATAAAQRALSLAESGFDKRAAAVTLARAAVQSAVERRLESQAIERETLQQAVEPVRQLVRDQPGDLEASEVLLTAAILLDRPQDAQIAWDSYYFVTSVDPAPPLVAEPGERLRRLLADWKGTDAPPVQRIELAKALADTRFHLEGALAALAAEEPQRRQILSDPRIREILAYVDFCRRIRRDSNEFYRRTILGTAEKDAYHRLLESAVRELWTSLDGPSSPAPSYDRTLSFRSKVDRELAPRFGGHFALRNSSGYRSLHFGHRVARRSETVEQYGRKATVTYTVLDRMVSNGFQGWAWNNNGQTAGWADATKIVSIRPALIRDVVNIWNIYDSPEELAIFQAKLQKDNLLDDERARKNPTGYLPGLKYRLALAEVDKLVQELKAGGLQGGELRMGFINEVNRLGDVSAIIAHEGRHAIDMNLDPSLRAPELELTAKLSQVAFSPRPRFSMISILSENIGDHTPHGKANKRFMEGIVRWMKAHRSQIAGLDPQRPLLPQFDLLSDEQVIEVARSMDPLAREQIRGR